jgi:hypothetical protein
MNIRRHLWSAPFASLLLIALISCGAPGPPLPPSLELAKPVSDLRASRKGNRVSLSWTVPSETTDFALVRHLGPTHICRGAQPETNRCGAVASEIQPPQPVARSVRGRKKPEIKAVNASATDLLPEDLQRQNPAGFVNYAVETMNTHGRSAGLSNVVPIPLAPTLAPPTDLAAQVNERGVTLTWTAAHPPSPVPQLSYEYRIYRRQEGTTADAVAGDVALGSTTEVSFLDPGAGWQTRYQYHVTPVTIISSQPTSVQVEGDDSVPITVFVNDIYPPSVPSGLQAVASGVGQLPFVELTWSPVTAADLAGYNLYRRDEGGEAVKINTDLIKSPSFRDVHVETGKTYSYSVTAVDLRNNESARSEETSERIP